MLSEIFFHKIIGSGPLFCSIGYIGSVRGKSKKSLIPDLQKDRHEGIVTCQKCDYEKSMIVSAEDCAKCPNREYKDGSLAPSRPCPSCMAMLRNLGMKRIFYTTEEGFVEEKFR